MGITAGKRRHLARVATANGHFVVLAIDHRANLRAKLDQHAAQPLDDAAFAAFKHDVLAALIPHSSGVLIDPAFGIAPTLSDHTLTGRTGLLAPLEVTDYTLHPSQRDLALIPDWSIGKMKRLGCDGVKLLLPYHPDAPNAHAKRAAVTQIVAECTRLDLPFFLEPIAYSRDPDLPLSNAELRQVVVNMAQTFSTMGVDILKMQFPVDAAQSRDLDEWRSACEALNTACGQVPWALLSAGVDFDTFAQQAEIACTAGASGVIVGRAVWTEAITHTGDDRAAFLTETAPARMQRLATICADHATAWHDRTPLHPLSADWYTTYSTL